MTNPTQALTAGQKAALTRAQNKAGNGTLTTSSSATALAKAKTSEGNVRLSGLDLTLLMAVTGDLIRIGFTAKQIETGDAFPSGLSTNERGLTELSWTARVVDKGGEHDVLPHFDCRVNLPPDASAYMAGTAGALGLRLEREYGEARTESEDNSLPALVQWLAVTFRVNRLVIGRQGKPQTEHKRGTVYRDVFRLCEELVRDARKPVPAPKKAA